MSKSYLLPCSQQVLCEDRFSILDSDELHVPFWPMLEKLLQQRINSAGSLIDVLETIAVCRQGKTDTDYGTLKQFLLTQASSFFADTWPMLARIALQMPVLFPSGHLPVLDEKQHRLTLSKTQTACLVIHQFLCTLTAPTWQDGFQDFHIWYSEEQPHAKVVHAYLTALFVYFKRITLPKDDVLLPSGNGAATISYTLLTSHQGPSPDGVKLNRLEIVRVPEASTSPDLLGIPDGATVISANKYIGFGRTGTQEETHVGASPECCPAVLVTPPLRDEQVLVVVGAEAMVTIAGYGRDARCAETLRMEDSGDRWLRRTMLFMDALELDMEGRERGLPDLLPGKVERELRKAYLAFHSRQEDPYSDIYTGYWGCRTFGGNSGIKTLIQWCAASLAGCPMRMICSGKDQHEFGSRLERFVGDITEAGCDNVADIIDVLRRLAPEELGTEDTLVYLQQHLCS